MNMNRQINCNPVSCRVLNFICIGTSVQIDTLIITNRRGGRVGGGRKGRRGGRVGGGRKGRRGGGEKEGSEVKIVYDGGEKNTHVT
jgi:hypothetical protein